jgi:hypothetical protein
MPRLTRSALWAFGLLALSLEPTRCGLQPVTGQAAEIPPAIVITEGKTTQGFPYLFGGVSSNEREAMEKRAKDYNLKLVFAEKNGPYLSDVGVALASVKDGEIFAMAINGPWFYIQLPPGTYQAKATFKGQTKQIKNLRVTKDKPAQQTFIWDLGEKPENQAP